MTFSLALATAAAFNLVCHEAYFSLQGAVPQKMAGDIGPFFKVDLDSGRFCEGSCSETQHIAKVTPTELFLKLDNKSPLKQYLRISRESGAYESSTTFGDNLPTTSTGTCEVQPFTGFPARKF